MVVGLSFASTAEAGYEPFCFESTQTQHDQIQKCSIPSMKIEAVNIMDKSTFVMTFGAVYEHSPWVAEEAWEHRPFSSVDNLHALMNRMVERAGQSQQLILIKAHPELAGRLAHSGQLTAESRAEQAQAGLTSLPENLTSRLLELNRAYQQKFEFPFIICARLNNVSTILQAMENRLTNNQETEFQTALQEISKIAKLRLGDILI